MYIKLEAQRRKMLHGFADFQVPKQGFWVQICGEVFGEKALHGV
jgi:hypothetical protein